MYRAILLSVFVFHFSEFAIGQWLQTAGPFYPQIHDIAFNGDDAYAGTVHYINKSTDNGNQWNKLNTTFSYGNPTSFAFIGNWVLASNLGGHIVRSNDGGDTWLDDVNGFEGGDDAMAAAGAYVFAEASGVYRSADSGVTWTAANAGITTTDIRDFLVVGNTVYAGTANGVFATTDFGNNWNAASVGMSSVNIRALASSGTHMYAATSNNVYVSTDNAATWSVITPPGGYSFVDIAASGTYVYTADYDQMFRSDDYGTSWTNINTPRLTRFPEVLVTHDDDVFLGNRAGLFRSADHGITWTPVSTGLQSNPIYDLVAIDDRVLAFDGSADAIYTSDDAGDTWQWNYLSDTGVNHLERYGNTLYATASGVYTSTDNGDTWQRIDSNGNAGYKSYAFGAGVSYAGTFTNGVFRSLDGGYAWEEANNGLTEDDIPSMLGVGNTVLAGTGGGGVFRSTDNGMSWSPSNTGLGSTANVLDLAAFGSNIYAGTVSGLYRSNDDGQTWTDVTDVSYGIWDVADESGMLFVSGVSGGSVSADGGANWSDMNYTIGMLPQSMAVSATDVYVGDLLHGVWKQSVANVLSVPETSERIGISVYPNPCHGTTMVTTQHPGVYTTEVFDVRGRCVERRSFTERVTMETQAWPAGVYAVLVRDASGRVSCVRLVRE